MEIVYESIYLTLVKLIVTQQHDLTCLFIYLFIYSNTLTNMRQLGLNSFGQMGVCFGVNVGLESPAGD